MKASLLALSLSLAGSVVFAQAQDPLCNSNVKPYTNRTAVADNQTSSNEAKVADGWQDYGNAGLDMDNGAIVSLDKSTVYPGKYKTNPMKIHARYNDGQIDKESDNPHVEMGYAVIDPITNKIKCDSPNVVYTHHWFPTGDNIGVKKDDVLCVRKVKNDKTTYGVIIVAAVCSDSIMANWYNNPNGIATFDVPKPLPSVVKP